MKSPDRSTREFAFVVVALLSIVGGLPLLHRREPRLTLLYAAAVVLGIGLLFPRALAAPARWWMALAALLNRVTSAIILTLIFFVVITPAALYKRLTRKDALQRGFDHGATTYWSDREEPSPRADTLRRQY